MDSFARNRVQLSCGAVFFDVNNYCGHDILAEYRIFELKLSHLELLLRQNQLLLGVQSAGLDGQLWSLSRIA
jgi:hypothetical protein